MEKDKKYISIKVFFKLGEKNNIFDMVDYFLLKKVS